MSYLDLKKRKTEILPGLSIAGFASWICGLVIILGSVCLVSDAFGAELPPRPFLDPIFSDHMILQRNHPIKVWGWAKPGEKIALTLNGETASAITAANGKWEAKFHAHPAGGPFTLVTAGEFQTNVVEDVLFGDVWLCSGQSNMEMGIGNCNMPDEIATANFPQIRLLMIPNLVATNPLPVTDIRWARCDPKTVLSGGWYGFSAVGFFFGRQLHQDLNVPIGLIQSAWGGTVAEAWMSADTLETIPDFTNSLATIGEQMIEGGEFQMNLDNWCRTNDAGTREEWYKPETDISSWKDLSDRQAGEVSPTTNSPVSVWLRFEFENQEAEAMRDGLLQLALIGRYDSVWVNGKRVHQCDQSSAGQIYRVPGNVLNHTRNIVVVRAIGVDDLSGIGTPGKNHVEWREIGGTNSHDITISKIWCSDPQPIPVAIPEAPKDIERRNIVTVLFNGKIAPLLDYAIRGVIWYQGENNSYRPKQYRRVLPALIADWRQHFNSPQLPFYVVQLAAFEKTNSEPRNNDWAELREAQALTARSVPHSGLAVTIDIGNAEDIHPKNKREVGRRLALCALANTYGQKVEWSGPWYKSMKLTSKGALLSFNHADGLVAKGDRLVGFAIAGEDRKFVWADAEIQGDHILVSSPQIPKPVAVRYAWDINPVCNLYNGAGLPAVPFRTDHWESPSRDPEDH